MVYRPPALLVCVMVRLPSGLSVDEYEGPGAETPPMPAIALTASRMSLRGRRKPRTEVRYRLFERRYRLAGIRPDRGLLAVRADDLDQRGAEGIEVTTGCVPERGLFVGRQIVPTDGIGVNLPKVRHALGAADLGERLHAGRVQVPQLNPSAGQRPLDARKIGPLHVHQRRGLVDRFQAEEILSRLRPIQPSPANFLSASRSLAKLVVPDSIGGVRPWWAT